MKAEQIANGKQNVRDMFESACEDSMSETVINRDCP